MDIETLDSDYYRGQADLCLKLAASAQAAKPLFARLYSLAEAYKLKAAAADLKGTGKPAKK
jgi:hypothetical protein